ncbi:MAG: hypothetical protein SWY16_13180 [Cyanobacteriota bacterium]|nr:hypothetical protein [Cyanobacteriota bacterium]
MVLTHLLVGNLFIGYIEGFVLAKWFRIPRGPTTAIVVLANYASAWAGLFLLFNRLSGIANVTFENAYFWVGLCVILAFLLTLLVEYPFFWFLLRKQEKAVRQSLKATLVVHCISYALLFVWYGVNSPVSLVTQLDVVSVSGLQPQEEYVLYFIDADGKQVVRSDLEGKNQEAIAQIDRDYRWPQLFACKNEEKQEKGEEEQFDLSVGDSRNNKQLILSDFAASIPTTRTRDCHVTFLGEVPKLTDNTNWDYHIRSFDTAGIRGENEKENLSFNFALETLFISWPVKHATHLEGDYAVFELDGDRIYILQPQEKKIALITRGQNPIVVKPKL